MARIDKKKSKEKGVPIVDFSSIFSGKKESNKPTQTSKQPIRSTKNSAGHFKYLVVFIIIIALLSVAYYQFYVTKPKPQEQQITSPYKIAFSMIIDGNEDIYLVDTEGNLERVTTSPGREFLPSWSPDRSKIAFVSTTQDTNGDIYVLDMATRNGRRINNNPAVDTMPVWSKDGKSIAFLSSRNDNKLELYQMNADGTNDRRRTNTTKGIMQTFPIQWLPDRKLAFAYRPDNEVLAYTVDIYGNLEQVSSGYAVVSPDSKKIAYTFPLNRNSDIYVADINPDFSTSERLRLTDSQKSESNPDWSPDGSAIVFVRDSEVSIGENLTASNIRDIYIVGSDGCCLKKIASGNINLIHFPAWSR